MIGGAICSRITVTVCPPVFMRRPPKETVQNSVFTPLASVNTSGLASE